jgi:hypothetical protein
MPLNNSELFPALWNEGTDSSLEAEIADYGSNESYELKASTTITGTGNAFTQVPPASIDPTPAHLCRLQHLRLYQRSWVSILPWTSPLETIPRLSAAATSMATGNLT